MEDGASGAGPANDGNPGGSGGGGCKRSSVLVQQIKVLQSGDSRNIRIWICWRWWWLMELVITIQVAEAVVADKLVSASDANATSSWAGNGGI